MATVGQLVHVPQDNETICHLPCAGIVSFKRDLKLYLLKLFVGNYSGCFCRHREHIKVVLNFPTWLCLKLPTSQLSEDAKLARRQHYVAVRKYCASGKICNFYLFLFPIKKKKTEKRTSLN